MWLPCLREPITPLSPLGLGSLNYRMNHLIFDKTKFILFRPHHKSLAACDNGIIKDDKIITYGIFMSVLESASYFKTPHYVYIYIYYQKLYKY